MNTQKIYKVTSQKQLVDLNGNSINFDLNFTAQSKNGEPFEILVVDQSTLDSNNELQYKKAVDGKINGNVLTDKNIYQNYFLILRAEKECEVMLQLQKKELPITQPSSQNMYTQQQRQPAVETFQNMQQPSQIRTQQVPVVKTKAKSNFKFYMIVLVVILGLGALYYFYTKKKNTENSSVTVKASTPTPVKASTPTPVKASTPTPVKASAYNSELLNRLNKLKI